MGNDKGPKRSYLLFSTNLDGPSLPYSDLKRAGMQFFQDFKHQLSAIYIFPHCGGEML